MDRSFFLRVIGQNLKDIDELFNLIKKHEGRIPQIELDIIMKSLRTAYEYFYQLEKVNRDENSTIAQIAGSQKKDKEAPVPPPEPAKPQEDRSPDDIEPEKEKKEEEKPDTPSIPQKLPSPDDVAIKDDAPAPEHPSERENKQENKTARTTADLFTDGNTLADKLKTKDDTRVADKIQKSPVKNLRSAIGINEKFLLLNELFGGKMKDYEEAIGQFESCTSLEESSRVLNSYKSRYNWSQESDAYQAFDNLLKRKFH